MKGFPDSKIALQTEWKIKHSSKKGIKGRIDALKYCFSLEKMTSNSVIMNKDLNINLYLLEEYLPIELPENIKIYGL